jgi:Leucine-rich repeat (LRR) protein
MMSYKCLGIIFILTVKSAFSFTHAQTEFKSIKSAFEAHNEGKAVTILNLKKQKLKTIPHEIQVFTELIELRLDKNKIKNLPNWLSELKHLEILSIEKNQLEKIPSVILELENLRELYLGDNNITLIPIDIDALKNLEWLGLWSNLLRIFPSSLGDMPKLTTLDIIYNDMTFYEQTWLIELLPHINIEMSEPCNCTFDEE